MAEQFIKLVDDTGNTGKKIRVLENTVGGNVVEQQVLSLADSAGNLLEGTSGALPVKHGATPAVTGNLTAQTTTITGAPAAGSTLAATVTGYSRVAVQVTGTYVGTLAFDGSNDGGTTYNVLSATRSDGAAVEQSSGALTNVTRLWFVDVAGLTTFRLRCAAYTSGTLVITITPVAGHGGLTRSVQGNVASAATDSGNPVKVGGVYNTTAPALTAGQRGDLQVDPAGNLKVAPLPPGSAVADSHTGAATVLNCTLAGAVGKTTYLAGFTLTGLGATAAGSIQITTTGLATNLNFTLPIPAGVTVGVTPLVVSFDPPLPASAPNTPIVVQVPSFGAGNTVASSEAHGFQV